MRRSLLCFVLLAGCGSSVKVAAPLPGELIGRVEISADVPAASCQVLLEGTPLGGKCDENGEFDVRNVPPGRWDLRLITDGAATALPAKRVAAASNPGLVSDVGAVRLARPGSIGGHILNPGGTDLSVAVIAVPDVGAVTVPNANNGFLLDAVSPGVHEVVLITDAGTVVRANVNVLPQKVTIGADLDLMAITPNMVSVSGRALRAGQGDGLHAGITVELVENVDGKVLQSAMTGADGAFSLSAKYGTYIVRAHDGSKPITAIVPSVVVRGSSDVHLSTAMAVQPDGGDLDGDGIPDSMDDDIDGDGFPNAMDAFPYDPAEHLDTDGDGVGDRSDLKSMGGHGIDHHNDTPDTDGDGKLDFEDNCPKVANPDQKDSDGDGVGDACDNCPFVPNPDQADSVGNGIGDACRFCKSNQDCGSGKICQFGQCLDCISSAQCGDKVCDLAKGACVACDAAHLCPGTGHCGANGRCVQCLFTVDCPANQACVQDTCVPQCQSQANCLNGQFCVSGGCVQCRNTADCTGTNYCDQGACRPQCVTTNDCNGGRACDPATHTCVLPCSGMCMNGQTCAANICRTICNQTQPCGTGQTCTGSGYCGPECTMTVPDCNAKPFTVCTGGMCVASGSCATDLDCPVSQICSVGAGPPGTCQPRPTALDGNGKYTCSSVCQCRLGEICSAMSECIPDPIGVPTRFLSSTAGSAGGDGKTALNAFNALSMISSAVPGDVFAIKGGDTLSITAAQAISQPNVAVAGGYQTCGTNRWVRDDSKSSIVSNTATNGKGAFMLTGTPTTPLDHVVFRGLEIDLADNQSTGTFRAIDATYAPHLTITHLLLKIVTGVNSRTLVGVGCTNCDNVAWTDLSTPGVVETNSSANLTFAEVVGGSGSFSALHVAPVTAPNFYAVHLANVNASSTIDGTQVDGYTSTVSFTADVIRVENAPNGTITVSNSQLRFAPTGAIGGTLRVIYAKNVASLALTGNLIDGSTLSSNNTSASQTAIAVEDSNGLVSMNTINFPQFFAGNNTLNAVTLFGPRGGVLFDKNTSSGGIGNTVTLASVDSITSGPARFTGNNFSSLGTVATGRGFYVHSSIYSNTPAVIATDNQLAVGGQTGGSTPQLATFYVDGGNALFERNRMTVGSGSGLFNAVKTASTLELYDNYVAYGVGGSFANGIEMYDTSVVNAIGNTIDVGGAPSTSTTRGLYCSGLGAGSSFISNLINGGRGATHLMVFNANTNCINASQASSKNNYFWYSGTGPQQAGEAVYSLTGGSSMTGPLNNNLVDTAPSNGCYDMATTQPDLHIGTSSVCVDKGFAGARRDTTAITADVLNLPRMQGTAPDIGCFEAK